MSPRAACPTPTRQSTSFSTNFAPVAMRKSCMQKGDLMEVSLSASSFSELPKIKQQSASVRTYYFGAAGFGVAGFGAVVPEGRGRLADGAEGAGAATPEDAL